MTDILGNRPAVMAASITMLTYLMESDRREFFMRWLYAHGLQMVCSKSNIPDCVYDSLVIWFGSLSNTRALQEYELIIGEISWWRDLKDESLARMLDAQKVS